MIIYLQELAAELVFFNGQKEMVLYLRRLDLNGRQSNPDRMVLMKGFKGYEQDNIQVGFLTTSLALHCFLITLQF